MVAPSGPSTEDVVPHLSAAEPVVDLVDVDVHRGGQLRVPQPALNLLEGLAARANSREPQALRKA